MPRKQKKSRTYNKTTPLLKKLRSAHLMLRNRVKAENLNSPSQLLIPALCFFVGLFFLVSFLTLPSSPKRLFHFETSLVTTNSLPAAKIIEKSSWKLFHPVWKDPANWVMLPKPEESNNNITISRANLDAFIKDPKKRIEKEFQVPEFLKDRVLFWMLVHSQYSRRFRIIHDRNNPSIVYGYIDHTPLYRKLGLSKVLEKRIHKVEKEIKALLKEKLLAAVDPQKANSISTEEREKIRIFLSRIGALSKENVTKLIKTIRTQTGQSDEFYLALHRSKLLLPHIKSVFTQATLPSSLSSIPFVESSFNDRAHSKVGAMGIWQFMPATARELIHPDDRKLWADPIHQTKAAATMLRNYRSVLPDWGTTITSYNSGIGRVKKILRRHKLSGIKGLIDISQKKEGLGFAGMNFFAQFLSANIVEAYKNEIFDFLVAPADAPAIIRGSIDFPHEVCELESE